MKKILSIVMILSVVVFAAACGSSTNDGPVAIVNGVEITRAEFDYELEQNITMYQMQGYELSDDDVEHIKQMVIDQLINTTLLLSAAEERGITKDSVDVQGELDAIISQFEDVEDFEEALEQEGFTLEEYKELIAEFLMVQKLFEQELDLDGVEVTEEEVKDMYEMLKAQYEAADQDFDFDFADLEDYLISEIKEDKSDALIGDFIEQLRENSQIEYLDI